VQLDGRVVALFLAVFLIVVLIVAAIVIGGFVAARRAGRGSRRARSVWLVITAVEAAAAVMTFIGKTRANQLTFWIVVVIAAQAGLFQYAREGR
jgi:hypothetical protein